MMWQIKEAPGWRVAHQVNTLEEAVTWLQARGADIAGVAVLTASPWLSLAEHVANKSPNEKLSHEAETKTHE